MEWRCPGRCGHWCRRPHWRRLGRLARPSCRQNQAAAAALPVREEWPGRWAAAAGRPGRLRRHGLLQLDDRVSVLPPLPTADWTGPRSSAPASPLRARLWPIAADGRGRTAPLVAGAVSQLVDVERRIWPCAFSDKLGCGKHSDSADTHGRPRPPPRDHPPDGSAEHSHLDTSDAAHEIVDNKQKVSCTRRASATQSARPVPLLRCGDSFVTLCARFSPSNLSRHLLHR